MEIESTIFLSDKVTLLKRLRNKSGWPDIFFTNPAALRLQISISSTVAPMALLSCKGLVISAFNVLVAADSTSAAGIRGREPAFSDICFSTAWLV